MIDLDVAWQRIAETVRILESEQVPLAHACGRITASPLVTPAAIPAFDRSLVDGYGIQAADMGTDRLEHWQVVAEVPAGVWPSCSIGPGQAARIMTGGAIPEGVDAVIPVERALAQPASENAEETVRFQIESPRPGMNIQRQGAIVPADGEVLAARRSIGAAEIGVAAEIGATSLQVSRIPRVAVITTGDELVAADQTPEQGRIRDSNGPMLVAALGRRFQQPISRTHATDDPDSLETALQAALAADVDVIVTSGGVSAGVRDRVPQHFEALGAKCHFHKLSLKPGKPLWFGTLDQGARRRWLFGLPGNPISGLIGCELFVLPLGLALQTGVFQIPRMLTVSLTATFMHRGDRPTFWPARWSEFTGGELGVETLPWVGSADLPRVAAADGWIAFPAGDIRYDVGAKVRFLPRVD